MCTGRARLTTKAASEILIQRRLSTLTDSIGEYKLSMDVSLVKSSNNSADQLTQVLQRWLTDMRKDTEPMQQVCASSVGTLSPQQMVQVHRLSRHLGVKQTLYFARRIHLAMLKAAVRMAVN